MSNKYKDPLFQKSYDVAGKKGISPENIGVFMRGYVEGFLDGRCVDVIP
ncbi:hypothetical protein [Neobacillus cucumis]|nr:hypothetical protein [Neobacillus cucumis]MBM7656215.1 hypothetical protein [Neobacillus cucumis]